jgi:hypothetical protein
MTAYAHGTNNRVVDTYAGVVANDHIAYGIIDARIRLYYAVLTE